MRCVLLSCLLASLGLSAGLNNFAGVGVGFFRAMTRRCRTRCLRFCALGILRMRLDFVVMRTNRGALRASADLFSSRGLQFVSVFFPVDDLKLNSGALSVSHNTAIRCCGRRRGRGSGLVVRKQATRVVEDDLHARRPRFPPVVRRTRFIRRARAVRPDLGRPQVRLSHVGRRALGDDFGFMRRAAERGACAVRWGVLGAL
jgi:hypothetical protein